MNTERNYWFPRNRQGKGLDIPNCWQGWTFLAVFFVLVGVGYLALEHRHPVLKLTCLIISTWLFQAVVKLKGQPPRGR